MQIPKKIEKLIDRRTKLANQLFMVSSELDEWLDGNGIEAESFDTHGGVEIYTNANDSADRVKKAILDK